MKFNVLRIDHDEATDIDTIRKAPVFEAGDHEKAARNYLRAADEPYFTDHFDLVVMDESGNHVTFDIDTKTIWQVKLHEHQCLDG